MLCGRSQKFLSLVLVYGMVTPEVKLVFGSYVKLPDLETFFFYWGTQHRLRNCGQNRFLNHNIL
jgi:hypothetical protein